MTALDGTSPRNHRISAADLRTRLIDASGEIAVLDLREESRFGGGHLLSASSAPLSRIEVLIVQLVPRLTTPIVIYDDGDGLCSRGRDVLNRLGYDDVAELDGGVSGWVAAGHELFDGLNIPGKALGAFAHRDLAIPEISPDDLAARLDHGDDIAVLDCRPFPEYQQGTVPGAINCPGAELVRSAAELAQRETLVVTCAGRSRGLIGAQTLIDAGFSARVLALENGTMGWQVSGRNREVGADRSGSDTSLAASTPGKIARARSIRTQCNLDLADADSVAVFCTETTRTTYIFDIRNRPQFEAGHIAGARHVAGGQLLHTIDMHAATRGARLVVSDDDGVRATYVALWLKRLGWKDVYIAPIAGSTHHLETGPEQSRMLPAAGDVPLIAPAALNMLLASDRAAIIDLATSRHYRQGHIPGAWFVKRSHLHAALGTLEAYETVVLTSEDGVLAAYAARDNAATSTDLQVLGGGTAAWKEAGLNLATDVDRLFDAPDDVHLKPSEQPPGPERDQAMQAYLGGLEDLLEKVLRDGSLRLAHAPLGQGSGLK